MKQTEIVQALVYLILHDIWLFVKPFFHAYPINLFFTRRTEMVEDDRILRQIDDFL